MTSVIVLSRGLMDATEQRGHWEASCHWMPSASGHAAKSYLHLLPALSFECLAVASSEVWFLGIAPQYFHLLVMEVWYGKTWSSFCSVACVSARPTPESVWEALVRLLSLPGPSAGSPTLAVEFGREAYAFLTSPTLRIERLALLLSPLRVCSVKTCSFTAELFVATVLRYQAFEYSWCWCLWSAHDLVSHHSCVAWPPESCEVVPWCLSSQVLEEDWVLWAIFRWRLHLSYRGLSLATVNFSVIWISGSRYEWSESSFVSSLGWLA